MNISIRFSRPTIKLMTQRLQQAYAAGGLRVVRSNPDDAMEYWSRK